MRRFVWFSVLVLCGLLPAEVASGQVAMRRVVTDSPYLRYEGVLTDPSGARVAGEYTMAFRIYDLPEGGSALWAEEKDVEVEGGLFTVTLGRELAIPADLLVGEGKCWVELEVEGEVLSPRSEIVGVGGSNTAASSGGVLGGGPGATPFGGTPTGPAGGDLTGNYPDPLIAPDAVGSAEVATDALTAADIAADAVGSSEIAADAVGSSEIAAGAVGSSEISDGAILNVDVSVAAAIDPTKISGTAWTSANDGPGSGLNADLLDGLSSESFLSTASDYGRSGVAADLYEGASTLTSKYVNEVGPDEVTGSGLGSILQVTNTDGGTGLIGESTGDSPLWAVGLYGEGTNTSTGVAIGGWCKALSPGTGDHYGLYSEGEGNSSGTVYGVHGSASNTSNGEAYGGYFATGSSGTGRHTGVLSEAFANAGNVTYGIDAWAENTGSGEAVGGRFQTDLDGTGLHFGIRAQSFSEASGGTYGVDSFTGNYGSGDVYAGYFTTYSDGTGIHNALYADANGIAEEARGIYASAENSGSDRAYGGYFVTEAWGTGTHYGLYADADGTVGSTNPLYGGYFTTSSSGSGAHYGLYTTGYGSSSENVRGIYSYASNSGSGETVGGRFYVTSAGTGTHYGVYGYEAGGGTGAAVYASGDMVASGAKPAVVKTSRGHRFLYAQESPEVWFEDFGRGRLVDGRIHIDLDPLFLETVTIDDEHPMEVFIQLTDENCKGTAVRSGMTGFDVIELAGGTSAATFSYRVVAKRRGYEDERFRQTDVGYNDPNLYPELLAGIEGEQREERGMQETERERRREVAQRIERERGRMEGNASGWERNGKPHYQAEVSAGR